MLKPLGDRVVLKVEEKEQKLADLSLQATAKQRLRQQKLSQSVKVFVL